MEMVAEAATVVSGEGRVAVGVANEAAVQTAAMRVVKAVPEGILGRRR